MLFILFFPHLIAGPIVRARDFLPQIRRRKRWDWMRIELGVRFFLMGLFKKWFIADRMALFADPVFQYPSDYSGAAIAMAVIAYALEIYGDFSGYTDMAIGTAHMLGFHLAKNFDMPYLSANVVGVLASLAHFAIDVVARLSLHSAGRQSRRQMADLSQFAHHHDARRPLAWGELDVYRLGLAARNAAHRPSAVSQLLRRTAAVAADARFGSGDHRPRTRHLPGGLSLLGLFPRSIL